jgi:putative ABC transport system substrate-binding protein
MKRRVFLAAIGAAVVLQPSCGLAQRQKVPVVGVLVAGVPDPSEVLALFRQALRERGYVEGETIRLEVRNAEGHLDQLPALAAGLVRDKVDIIATWQTPASLAAKRATSDIPIVILAAADPVGSGLVASLARPGGIVTGIAAQITDLGRKSLEVLKEALPSVHRVAALALAGNPFSTVFLKDMETTGQRLGLAVESKTATPGASLDDAFAAIAADGTDAVLVLSNLPERSAADLALKHRLPAVSTWRPFAEAGGLLAYAFDDKVLFRQGAVFVDKILKGAKPAELPVEQPTKFELVVNLNTAKALGLALPPLLLARADEVIE